MNAAALLARLKRLGVRLRLEGEKLRYDAPKDKLTPTVLDELRAHKAELIEFLQEAAATSRFKLPAVEPVPRDADLPLSFPQERLWFMDKLGAGSAYNTPLPVRLSGPLDVGALEESLRLIVRRHEVLRTTFDIVDGRPVQHVAPEPDLSLERVDLGGLPENDREETARRMIVEKVCEPFDLTHGPLLRSTLFRLGEDEHVLLFVVHHIVFDGWSMGVLQRELSEFYAARTTGRSPRLPELPVQYADFAHWQRECLRGERLDSLLGYWRDALGRDLPVLEMPTDRPRPAEQTFRGAAHQFVLSRELVDALDELSRSRRTSLAITMLAAFDTFLSRYTGQDDIVVGTPIANRERPEFENLIGFFVNTVVFRGDLSGDPTFTDVLDRVRRSALSAYEHQDLPFERLVENLSPERDLGRSPLFQVIFAMQTSPPGKLELPGIIADEFYSEATFSRFDLEVNLFPEEDGAQRARIFYNTDLFDDATIVRMASHFRTLLEGIAADPATPISKLPLLDDEERQQVLPAGAGQMRSYSSDLRVHERFEASAEAAPDAPALTFEGRSLSYGELNARANRLAHLLRARGVGPEVLVGVCIERSLDLVVAILAVLKAGGAYVPLDPDYPKQRQSFILEDARAKLLLTQSPLTAELPDGGGEVMSLDTAAAEIDRQPETNPAPVGSASDPAYVIYTSGSTGTPKGVVVQHDNLSRLFTATEAWYGFDASDVWTLFHSSAFDFSVWEIWGALLYGGRLVVVPYETSRSPEEFHALVRREGVTVLNQTPSAFRQFIQADASSEGDEALALALRYVIFGGEALELESLRPWYERHGDTRPQLVNMYGITETTVHVTYRPLGLADLSEAPGSVIGCPIPDLKVVVLDAHGQRCPVGVPGEMYVGGAGVARGYLSRPALTAERFVTDPHGEEAGARLYRTGDVARLLANGELEYLGRNDEQVKVRGFRIELGEIETALLRDERVREAVTMVREDDPGTKRIVAYVVLHVETGGREPAPGELRRHLAESLPEYMIPSSFVFLDAMPLTAHGKLDRRSLPAPSGDRQVDEAYIAPRGEIERRIAAILRDVLRIDRVGTRDNFFDLGVHSLQLVEVHAKLVEQIDCDLKVTDMFRYPTVASLAERLGGPGEPHPRRLEASRRVAVGGSGIERSIAIIAMAGRFPGAPNIETFWTNLRDGVESIRFFDEEALRKAGVSEEQLRDPLYVPAKASLADADQFDARFFGCTPREAEILDPQQRLFLECAWSALESAGYDPDRIDAPVGVYAGGGSGSYARNVRSHPNLVASVGDFAVASYSEKDQLATHVAYKLNLRGPAVSIHTACSTSLVAVHEACKSLLAGECSMALAGGSRVTVPLETGYVHQERGILSRDGHCRPFDAEGTGTIGGDGVGVVVLKRLEDALADRDPIHAVIRGSAINNDGSQKVGFTAPSVDGQVTVISEALRVAEVDPATITYVETHGTATELGDPIEFAALTEVFGGRSRARTRCALGALKSNVGHMDATAGVGGLIKAVLALKHRKIPPSLHYRTPNPQIDFASSPFFVNAELRDWDRDGDAPLRAGVSSFGIGGTNAHVVLEEAPAVEPSDAAKPWQVLTLSARTATALDRATDDLAAHLEGNPDCNLADVAYTLQTGRKEFAHRRAVVCKGVADAVEALASRDRTRVFGGVREPGAAPVVFLFTGQGAQYPQMGRGLYESEAVFRAEVDRCCEILREPLGFDLRDLLFPSQEDEESARERLNRTQWTQPALFVIEYAQARLWMSWGVRPEACIGHSIGEYVAACLSGVIGLEAALGLVAERGRLMGELPGGSMLAVPLAEEELAPLVGDRVSIATLNGPTMCVVSGEDAAIAAVESELRERGVEPRMLHTSHAFHSPMMDPIVEPFTKRVRGVALSAPKIPFVSNVTGDWITESEATDPTYWARHLRQAVRFSAGLETLFADPERVLLEVGPGNTLASLARRHPSRRREQAVVSSLRHPTEDRADEATMLEGVGRLWLAGVRPDWAAVHAGARRQRVELPTYPFERQRYWIEASKTAVTPDRLVRKPDPADWLYVPSWRPAPLSTLGQEPSASHWLVFADGYGLGDLLANALEEAGAASVIRVRAGEHYSRQASNRYVVVPGEGDHYIRLLESLADDGKSPSGVVHLWSVTPGEPARPSPEWTMETGFYSLMHLARALASSGREEPLDLTVVTTGAQDVTGEEHLDPWSVVVLGPCKTLAMELPDVRCRGIDVRWPVTAEHLESLASNLAKDVSDGPGDAVVAYRGQRRWAQGFEQVRVAVNEVDNVAPPVLRDGGVYLITGGLGGVGLELASYLVDRTAAKLVLYGRTGLPPTAQWDRWIAEHDERDTTRRRIEQVRALEARGGKVLVLEADVTDAQSMARVVSEAEAHFGALHGVIHAAGVGNARTPIRTASRADCERVFGPKLIGLSVLDEALGDRALDFVLVHSSLASVMGALEGSAYSGAHLFMDAYTHQRSREGRVPWLTLNWDTWDTWKVEPGTYGPGVVEFMMAPAEFGEALTRALALASEPQILLSSGDVHARIDHASGRDRSSREDETSDGEALHPRPVLDADYVAPRNEVERELSQLWEAILGIERVGIHDNFFELGGDSVVELQIVAKANAAGFALTAKDVFTHQTIAELAELHAGRNDECGEAAHEPDDRTAVAVEDATQPVGYTAVDMSESDLAKITRQVKKGERGQ